MNSVLRSSCFGLPILYLTMIQSESQMFHVDHCNFFFGFRTAAFFLLWHVDHCNFCILADHNFPHSRIQLKLASSSNISSQEMSPKIKLMATVLGLAWAEIRFHTCHIVTYSIKQNKRHGCIYAYISASCKLMQIQQTSLNSELDK